MNSYLPINKQGADNILTSEWKLSKNPCPKCGEEMFYQVDTDPYTGYESIDYACDSLDCGYAFKHEE